MMPVVNGGDSSAHHSCWLPAVPPHPPTSSLSIWVKLLKHGATTNYIATQPPTRLQVMKSP
ncbi:hypothetical protein FIBSPDRAFT_10223 [Athelia psychrophila]|uniref:Uncharacterized protein n=1 Tax=Athelia psychrophila TaxID=1759441 RepID=A0A166X7D6_9AGAM|nr:hypothetical protein FIBSPDRAFT_10223 [Fibularhizoctonia sp. CBS 109695]